MRVERAPAAATACSRGSAASLRAPTCTVSSGAAGEGAGSMLYAAGESGLPITGRYPTIITSLEILLPSSIVITAGRYRWRRLPGPVRRLETSKPPLHHCTRSAQ